MRFVVYDDESLEPITVLNLPITERDALERRVWRVAVPQNLKAVDCQMPCAPYEQVELEVVDLFFEPFHRSRRGETQRSVFCFTKAAALAMLLNPAWLPGQRSAVDYLQEQNDRLTSMLMANFDWG